MLLLLIVTAEQVGAWPESPKRVYMEGVHDTETSPSLFGKGKLLVPRKISHHTEKNSGRRTSLWGPGLGWEAQATL